MRSKCQSILLLSLVFLASKAGPYTFADEVSRPVDFRREIKPILSNTCYRCHGPDAAERKGGNDGVRLDTADGIFAEIGGHAVVVKGKPESSELIKRVSSDDPDEAMPPQGSGKRLSSHEIDLLKAWIRQGARFSRHWSYEKPVRPALPPVRDANWGVNAIDRFILARLEREGQKPSPEADRYALARRVSMDLIGLPPTIEEVDAFVKDSNPNAYEAFVDRTLAKSAYGEHWGLLWLDLARYADSAGYADDPARTIWLYRDYVIKSFNANKPFDQFTIEQIAGDLLPDPTEDQLIATAFHRNTMTNNEGGTNDEEFRNVAIVDRVNTTMAVWMGTTMACAQCHTHKYDPITQDDYFRLFAFFNNTADSDQRDESPLLSVESDAQKQQRESLQNEISQIEESLKTWTPELIDARNQWDHSFPRMIEWSPLKPTNVESLAQVATSIADDGSVTVAGGAKTDTYTVNIIMPKVDRQNPSHNLLHGLRLDALPTDAAAGNGPGHANGNFVISKFSAKFKNSSTANSRGRFVRIELPGETYLSLAEVQVFSGAENIALAGEATQISTDFGGEAKLAIDGNTDGQFFQAKSTTHTAAGKDPWWELDLKSERDIDRLVLWNRTDGSGERLVNYRVLILNNARETVWKNDTAAVPNPSIEFVSNGSRSIEFDKAFADYSQPKFESANVIKNPSKRSKGWAIGGATGIPHSLTLIAKHAIEVPVGSTLTVTIEHAVEPAEHTLAHFQLFATSESRIEEWAKAPARVVESLQKTAGDRSPEEANEISQYFLTITPLNHEKRQHLANVSKLLKDLKPDTVPIMRELTSNRRVTKVQMRGNFLDLGKEVTEDTPAELFPLAKDAPRNRLTLAKWLVNADNPLTHRVIANRYWEQLFGIGLVASSEDFGSQGDQPFHPELLDWLACELAGIESTDQAFQTESAATGTPRVSDQRADGRSQSKKSSQIQKPWDLKRFLKLLVMSSTYRQSSRVTQDLAQKDPDNRLLARGPRFRLSAEVLRDQSLFVSGLLSHKMYGPPVKPPQPSLGLSAAFGNSTDWETSAGEDRYRRGIYTTWRRSNPYPSMATFDAPNREFCTVRRGRTNTPLQALVTLNDPVYIEAAQALARRIVKGSGSTVTERANFVFRSCVARLPSDHELKKLIELFQLSLVRFRNSADEALMLATNPLGPAESGADIPELAAWTAVSNVLMNLDEFVMKR